MVNFISSLLKIPPYWRKESSLTAMRVLVFMTLHLMVVTAMLVTLDFKAEIWSSGRGLVFGMAMKMVQVVLVFFEPPGGRWERW